MQPALGLAAAGFGRHLVFLERFAAPLVDAGGRDIDELRDLLLQGGFDQHLAMVQIGRAVQWAMASMSSHSATTCAGWSSKAG